MGAGKVAPAPEMLRSPGEGLVEGDGGPADVRHPAASSIVAITQIRAWRCPRLLSKQPLPSTPLWLCGASPLPDPRRSITTTRTSRPLRSGPRGRVAALRTLHRRLPERPPASCRALTRILEQLSLTPASPVAEASIPLLPSQWAAT